MNKHQVKALVDELVNRSFVLRNVQKVTDAIYETVPFAFTGSVQLMILRCRIATTIARLFAQMAEEPALEMLAQHIEVLKAWHYESLEVWARTGSIEKVREFYAERAAERMGDFLH